MSVLWVILIVPKFDFRTTKALGKIHDTRAREEVNAKLDVSILLKPMLVVIPGPGRIFRCAGGVEKQSCDVFVSGSIFISNVLSPI